MLPQRLSIVDNLTRPDHCHLDEGDYCYYIGEYTARRGFSFSPTNQLIYNFKKKPDRRDRPEWRYKLDAIREIGAAFRSSLGDDFLTTVTLVPMPPSKVRGDPMYDDRMMQMLRLACNGLVSDIRELLLQRESTIPVHEAEVRPTVDDLASNFIIDESCAEPAPSKIALFDDLLTTGAHFKAAQRVIQSRFPGVPIAGFFVARRVPETIDIEDLRAIFNDPF